MIPKIVHQTWKGPASTIPEHWRASHQGWKSLEGWTYMFWTDRDIDQLIKQHYPWFLAKFRAYKYGIQRADAFRYFVLHHHGGLYVDLDIAPKPNFAGFYEMVKDYEVVISRNKEGNDHGTQNMTNSFMMSIPKSGFWPIVWDLLRDPYRKSKWKRLTKNIHYFEILFSTGPGVVSDAVGDFNGRIYKAPPALTQPGKKDQEPPIDTPESVVSVLQGSSWHQKDAKFFKAMGTVSNNAQWIFLALAVLFFITTIVFIVLWWRLRRGRSLKPSVRARERTLA